MGPSHHGMARSRVADRGYGLHVWCVAANVFNKQSRRPTRGGTPACGLGEGLTAPYCKKPEVLHTGCRNWVDSLE
jgi:hypothetical protein